MSYWRERIEPSPIFSEKDAALAAHARFLDYTLEALTALQVARGVEEEPADVASRKALSDEVAYSKYLVDSIQSIAVGMYGLIDELKKERLCMLAAVIAIARQKFCDFEKFQRDYIEAADGVFGGPDKVPENVRTISMIVLAQGRRED